MCVKYYKYIVMNEDGLEVALKYNNQDQIAIIGGKEKDREAFEWLLTFFKLPENTSPVFSRPTNLRAKYTFPCSIDLWFKTFEKMKSAGIVLKKVDVHKNLMR